MEIKRGQVAFSAAGRDKDKPMAVAYQDSKYVYVCDGKERPLNRPKRKNLKHLRFTEITVDEKSLANDSALRKALNGLLRG